MENKTSCEDYRELLIRYVDMQISGEDKIRLENHLKECGSCRNDLKQLQNWKEVSSEMKGKLLPDMAWDEYWQHLYNRLERGIGWILISIGAIILLGFVVYHFIMDVLNTTELTRLEKFGILSLALGFVVLLVSVIREKLMIRKYDKYKEVQR